MKEGVWILIKDITSRVMGIFEIFISIIHDTKKIEKQENRKIIEKKYNDFKNIYKDYKYKYAQLLYYNYHSWLKSNNFSKERIEFMENNYYDYTNILEDIIEVLEEDDYITQELTEYNELKQLYINILKIRGYICIEINKWKLFDELNKEEIIRLDVELKKLCEIMNDKLKKLNTRMQTLLYKNIVKNC